MSKNINNIDKAKKTILVALNKGITKATTIVETDAVTNAPVMTGALRQSINSEVNSEGTKVEGIVGTNIEYGIYVEFGEKPVPN